MKNKKFKLMLAKGHFGAQIRGCHVALLPANHQRPNAIIGLNLLCAKTPGIYRNKEAL